MKPRNLVLLLLVGAAAGPTAAGRPEAEPLAILYRDVGYRGPARTLVGPEPDLVVAWPVRSIRVRHGAWELCARAAYQGLCTRFDVSERAIPLERQTVRSARPVIDAGEA